MDIEIWEEKEVSEPLRLRLVQGHGEGVELIAVDQAGRMVDRGRLLLFHETGTTHLCSGVSKKLGLVLTADGEIVIV